MAYQSFTWFVIQPDAGAGAGAGSSGGTSAARAGLSDPLGNGIVRPFRRTARADFATDSGERLVMSDVGQLFGTRKGTLPWRHDQGLDLEPLRHKNNTVILQELGRARVDEALRRWAKNVQLRSVVAERVASEPGKSGHSGTGKNGLFLKVAILIGGREKNLRVPI